DAMLRKRNRKRKRKRKRARARKRLCTASALVWNKDPRRPQDDPFEPLGLVCDRLRLIVVERLGERGQHDRAVAEAQAGGQDEVLEPGAARDAIRIDERLVQCCELRIREPGPRGRMFRRLVEGVDRLQEALPLLARQATLGLDGAPQEWRPGMLV